MINSILDNDLYKYTMGQSVLFKFPDVKVKYTFTDRNNLSYPEHFDKKLLKELKKMENLVLSENEEKFLRNIPFLKSAYVDYFKNYRYDTSELNIFQDKNNKLHIEITGMWYRVIYWEVPILALISELFYKNTNQTNVIFNNPLDIDKLRLMESHNAYFSEFGTRRRFSYENQERIVKMFAETCNELPRCFVGTSNVHFAHKYNLRATGTMAHEWIMAHAAMFGYRLANKTALDNWADVYGGNLGIALSDTFTTDVFLQSFDMKLAKLFDGVRQDSGNPYVFADKVIAHYKKLGIDPMSKTIIFSDALTVKKATEIKEYCVGKIKSSFGIGTNLTNDVGLKPMNIVIKLSEVEVNGFWVPAVKLSDDKGKNMGDQNEVELCKKTLRIV